MIIIISGWTPLPLGSQWPGSCVRQLTNLNGGYSGLGGAHSDVHLWIHGKWITQHPGERYRGHDHQFGATDVVDTFGGRRASWLPLFAAWLR